jgi:hypothetical protein
MSVVIPLIESAEYTIRIELDGYPTRMRVYWTEYSDAIKAGRDTDGFWSMDLSNDLFDIKAVRIVGGTDLMWPYAYKFGGFVLFDVEGGNLDPEFKGIGNRWQLNYYPIDEVQELREALKLEAV